MRKFRLFNIIGKIDKVDLWMAATIIFLFGIACGATFQIFWMYHLYNTPIAN